MHYVGWNASHDAWVPRERILPDSAENRKRQADRKAKEAEKNKPAQSAKQRKSQPAATAAAAAAADNSSSSSKSTATANRSKRKSLPDRTPTAVDAIAAAAADEVEAKKKRKSTAATTQSTHSSRPPAPADEAASSSRLSSVNSTADDADADSDTDADSSNDASTRTRQSSSAERKPAALNRPLLPEHKIKIPYALKQWMAYDYVGVNRRQRLHQIPARITVEQIIEAFNDEQARNAERGEAGDDDGDARADDDADLPAQFAYITQRTVTDSLLEYFDALLGRQLLYRSDRVQHALVVAAHPAVPASRLYGAFHLLRLFGRLDQVLVQWSPLQAGELTVAVRRIERFLAWLERNEARYLEKSCWAPAEGEETAASAAAAKGKV